jgi:hypothetical protein
MKRVESLMDQSKMPSHAQAWQFVGEKQVCAHLSWEALKDERVAPVHSSLRATLLSLDRLRKCIEN